MSRCSIYHTRSCRTVEYTPDLHAARGTVLDREQAAGRQAPHQLASTSLQQTHHSSDADAGHVHRDLEPLALVHEAVLGGLPEEHAALADGPVLLRRKER